MSNSHINIQAEFFDNPLPQQLSLAPPEYIQHLTRIHQSSHGNMNSLATVNEGQISNVSNINKFYQEYKRIISVSHKLQVQKGRFKDILEQLQCRILKMEDKLIFESGSKPKDTKNTSLWKNQMNSQQNRNKRSRRTAQQIQKKYKCQVAFCYRVYGSQGSLQQHIKLKHPEILNRESQDENVRNHNKDEDQNQSL